MKSDDATRQRKPKASEPRRTPAPAADDRPYCPLCGGDAVEKKQKWFCRRCGQLIQTCCD